MSLLSLGPLGSLGCLSLSSGVNKNPLSVLRKPYKPNKMFDTKSSVFFDDSLPLSELSSSELSSLNVPVHNSSNQHETEISCKASSDGNNTLSVDVNKAPDECLLQLPAFSPSLHGFSCKRGELWLSDDENMHINPLLEPLGFSFKLVEHESESVLSGNTKRRKTVSSFSHSTGNVAMLSKGQSSLPIDISVPDNNNSNNTASASTSRPRRRVTTGHDAMSSGNGAAAKTTTVRKIVSVFEPINKSEIVKSQQSSSSPIEAALRAAVSETQSIPTSGTFEASVCGAAAISAPQFKSAKFPLLPTRTSRRRRGVLTGSWTESCMAVTDLLEKEPAARWFLTPVDPVAVPDYLDKVSCPMDLQTVRQKLNHGMYSHPFRWQEDIRTMFYNAFTYHPSGNLIWSDSFYLASMFEKLCRDHVGVNPYAVYETASKSTSKGLSSSNGGPVSGRSPARQSAAQAGITMEEDRSDTIVLEASKLRELLARAATVAATQHHQQNITNTMLTNELTGVGSVSTATSSFSKKEDLYSQFSNNYPASSNVSSRIIPTPLAPSATPIADGMSNDNNRTAGYPLSPTTGIVSSSSSNSDSPPVLPPPTLPPPPPPPIGTVRPGEKGPNIVHRRLVAAQFRQLDVHLRHAIMELVKDELGISPIVAACDPHFVIDLELLPYLKQKQLMMYLRTLDAFQRKMIEEGYHPTLVSTTNGRNICSRSKTPSQGRRQQQYDAPGNNPPASVVFSHSDTMSKLQQSVDHLHASKPPPHHLSKEKPGILNGEHPNDHDADLSSFSSTSSSSSSSCSSTSSSSSDVDDEKSNIVMQSPDPIQTVDGSYSQKVLNEKPKGAKGSRHSSSSSDGEEDEDDFSTNLINNKYGYSDRAFKAFHEHADGLEPLQSQTFGSKPNEVSEDRCYSYIASDIKHHSFPSKNDSNEISAHTEESSSSVLSSYTDNGNLPKRAVVPGFGKTGGEYMIPPLDLDDEEDEKSSDADDDGLNDEGSVSFLSDEGRMGRVENVTSSWGEWKAKVIQHRIQVKMGDEENENVLSISGNLARERDAELADAEI